MTKVNYKRSFQFKDANKNLVCLEAEIENGRFSISGDMAGSSGQIVDSIAPANKPQQEIIKIWNQYHLNDMKASCPHQRAEKWDEKRIPINELPKDKNTNRDDKGIIATWIRPEEHQDGLLTKPCPTCGYRYGSAWLKEDLPEDFEKHLDSTIDAVLEADQGVCDLTEDDLEKLEDDRVKALLKSLQLEDTEVPYIEEVEHGIYSYAGIEYYVMTENEIEAQAKSYLIDDPEIWKMSVQAGNTEKGLEDWAQDVIDIDGYGHTLNSWDSSEDEQYGYYIIRRS